jgi:multidrug resistance efflux pump
MVDSRTPDGFLQRVEVVRTHSATALTNALEYEGLFLMPVWRFLGRGTRFFRGRALPKTLAIIGGTLAAVAFLCFYPAEFKLEGDGNLRPTVRRHVWAEVNGEVQKVLVDHDEVVTKGQVLLTQRSRDLEKEIESASGDLKAAIAQRISMTSQRSGDADIPEIERSQRNAERRRLNEQIKSLQKQMELLEEKQELLQVRSPIDGRIVTWNPEERLGGGRPINRGEDLLEVADPTSDWELEVYMPEYRMGHIAKAQTASAEKLPVTFYLATNPGKELQGQVEEIHRSAEVRGEEGNTVVVRVSFDQEALRATNSDPKIGATATAKVHCGRRAIGYVWFHDLVDFVRAKILFRLR